jgi:uncharacterized protein YkwD
MARTLTGFVLTAIWLAALPAQAQNSSVIATVQSAAALGASASPAPVEPDAAIHAAAEAAIIAHINAARAARGLQAIPLSPSMNAVARAHVLDLVQHSPDRGACNPHSWSEQGNWTPVCYESDPGHAKIMWVKPAEVTGGVYTGHGYEIAWRAPYGPVLPARAVSDWEASPSHADVMLEQGDWAGEGWQAMGVGVAGPYAVVWFGQEPDPVG